MHTIGLQLTIPELTRHLSYSANAIGSAGEILIARALESQGYQVRIDHERGDLTAILPDGQIVGIEVKTARKSKEKTWRFTLYKKWQGTVRTDHKNADFVVLLCIMKSGIGIPFVIPTQAIESLHVVAITSHPDKYAGNLAQYRQNIRKLTLSL